MQRDEFCRDFTGTQLSPILLQKDRSQDSKQDRETAAGVIFARLKNSGLLADHPGRKNMLTKKVQGSEKTGNLLSAEIESFRMKQGLTVKEFCTLCHISRPQYSEYITGKNRYLLIPDAVRLLAAFPGKITVGKLLKWSGEKRLALSRSFPHIFFSGNTQTDDKETGTVFKNFIIKTAFDLFAPADAVKILASFLQPCSDDEIFLPMTDSMNYLMENLRRIRKIKFSAFPLPKRTVIAHIQRSMLPVRFSDICGYERLFRSGGIYLLSEIMYLSKRKKLGIKLCPRE